MLIIVYPIAGRELNKKAEAGPGSERLKFGYVIEKPWMIWAWGGVAKRGRHGPGATKVDLDNRGAEHGLCGAWEVARRGDCPWLARRTFMSARVRKIKARVVAFGKGMMEDRYAWSLRLYL